METELYLDCPRGADCQALWEAFKSLTGWTKTQEETLRGYCLPESKTSWISYEEAEKKIREWNWNQTITEKMLCVLASVRKEREVFLPAVEGESAFFYLAGLGMVLNALGILEIKLHVLGEGTKTHVEDEGSFEILKILEKSKLPVEFVSGEGELLTKNSAAFLAVFARDAKPEGRYYIKKAAMGGSKHLLRAILLSREEEELEEHEAQDRVWVLETNVDDCSGEQLGYAMECLMKAGALDVSCFPIYMKKHRPAYMLQVICKKEQQRLLEDLIFRETTSIGLRRYEENRRILPRTFQEISLKSGHKVKIKICEHHGQKYCYPEYETVKQVCRLTGRPYRSVYDEAAALAGGFYENL